MISMVTGLTIRRQHKLNILISMFLNSQRLLSALLRLLMNLKARQNIIAVTLYSSAEILFYFAYIYQIWRLNKQLQLFQQHMSWSFPKFRIGKKIMEPSPPTSTVLPQRLQQETRPVSFKVSTGQVKMNTKKVAPASPPLHHMKPKV